MYVHHFLDSEEDKTEVYHEDEKYIFKCHPFIPQNSPRTYEGLLRDLDQRYNTSYSQNLLNLEKELHQTYYMLCVLSCEPGLFLKSKRLEKLLSTCTERISLMTGNFSYRGFGFVNTNLLIYCSSPHNSILQELTSRCNSEWIKRCLYDTVTSGVVPPGFKMGDFNDTIASLLNCEECCDHPEDPYFWGIFGFTLGFLGATLLFLKWK
jgi:hypothetical protein